MPAHRDQQLNLRLTEEESRIWRERADAAGEALAVWIRGACRDRARREQAEANATPRRRAK